jgi:hypothetical protein
MTKKIEAGFLFEPVELAVEKLLPSFTLPKGVEASSRYAAVAASVPEVGIIEPLIVFPEKGAKGYYVILDGHVRAEVLKKLGISKVICLVAKDDENCTYNREVSHIPPIQEIGMIRKAIAAGVSEERIAKTLNLTAQTIRRNARRLKDICPEAIEILKDKSIPDAILDILRKVKAYRQVEMADLMARTGIYTTSYAKTLLMRTPKELLAPGANKRVAIRPDDLAKLENESHASEREFVLATESHGKHVMELMLIRAYMKKLLDNARVVRFMAQRNPDLLGQLQQVIEATSLEA